MLLAEIIAGGLLAGAVLYAVRRFDDRKIERFFAGSLLIAALVYLWFAVSAVRAGAASTDWILIEIGGVFLYLGFAYLGVKIAPWILASGWAAHVFWDVWLHGFQEKSFVPDFYPPVCFGFDIIFAVYILYRFYLKK